MIRRFERKETVSFIIFDGTNHQECFDFLKSTFYDQWARTNTGDLLLISTKRQNYKVVQKDDAVLDNNLFSKIGSVALSVCCVEEELEQYGFVEVTND